MIRVCAWCKKNLGVKNGTGTATKTITHGICSDCAGEFALSRGETLKQFLDRFNFPILVIDSETNVQTANAQACALLGKNLFDIEGQSGGNVIECVHAKLPGGCGQQLHCKSCTIRRTVTDTLATGKSHLKVKAYPDVQMHDTVKILSIEISTEKAGDIVLLRIDDML
jgi:PAS domain-containing protein